MLPKATLQVFRNILETGYREYLEHFPWEKQKYETKAALLRDEPEVYLHSFFELSRDYFADVQEHEHPDDYAKLRAHWGPKSLFMVMSATCWQEQYVAQAREDLVGRTGEETISPRTIRSFEKALEALLQHYPLTQHTLDLLRVEPEVCIQALFVAMRQMQAEDKEVQWYEVGGAAHPPYIEKARQDLQEEVSA